MFSSNQASTASRSIPSIASSAFMAGKPIHTALVVDFGGVLTTNIWDAFAEFCDAEGLEPETVKDLFRTNPEAMRLLRGLETGDLDEAAFEPPFAELLGLDESDGLIERLFGGLGPDEQMIGAVKAARAAGIKTGLISNSWGLGIYERAPIDLFDDKPEREIYELACERLGVAPGDCVFVDDLRENIVGAEAAGMTGLLHRDPAETVARLEELFGVSLS
jgi:putative hydrolase of the HAD superfamily